MGKSTYLGGPLNLFGEDGLPFASTVNINPIVVELLIADFRELLEEEHDLDVVGFDFRHGRGVIV